VRAFSRKNRGQTPLKAGSLPESGKTRHEKEMRWSDGTTDRVDSTALYAEQGKTGDRETWESRRALRSGTWVHHTITRTGTTMRDLVFARCALLPLQQGQTRGYRQDAGSRGMIEGTVRFVRRVLHGLIHRGDGPLGISIGRRRCRKQQGQTEQQSTEWRSRHDQCARKGCAP